MHPIWIDTSCSKFTNDPILVDYTIEMLMTLLDNGILHAQYQKIIEKNAVELSKFGESGTL